MVSVLHLINNVTSTSIPLEIAENIHTTTEIDVHVAEFYGAATKDIDPDVAEFEVPITNLGGQSRFDLEAYRKLQTSLDGVDILHTHHNFVGSAARIVAKATDVKIVNTEHNDHQYFSHLQNLVNAPTLPLVDCLIANSRATLNSFRWYERPAVRGADTQVVYNGVNLDRIDSQEPTDSFGDNRLIVTVGALINQKNQSVLIRAMREVIKQFPEAKLVIVGDGPLREELERTADEVGIASNVIFTGYVPTREEVYEIMKAATVFTMSSDYEGFCVAAVEAMACGVPVVASDLAVFREVIGGDGVFAERGNHKEFATALNKLLADSDRRSRLADRMKQRAETKFQLKKTAKEHRKIYVKLMNE